ncbi:4-pyridoxate dehydrogenase-like [Dermacentor albipictus]|uniref:4-pyridoxate dehydrogenase-like n=1 Tax=Dermacentor albipictus TaxID=60249 RepID=UPI0038FCF02C
MARVRRFGAGSAGCALANRLTADGTASVLLLEAGGLEDAAARVPFFSVVLQRTNIDWDYTSERQHNASLSVDDQVNRLPRGKVLGGCSSINHMIFARGNRKDFDSWASEYGAKGWSYDDVLPDFISIETSYLGIDNGFSRVQNNIRNGERGSCSRSFITNDVRRRKNFDVALYSHVTKVLFEGATAVGVEYKRDLGTDTVRAKKEVILCAGAIDSPQLLMLSAIGPREHLESLGISVIADLPVGQNLFDHITVNGIAATTPENIEINYYSPSTVPLYSLFRTGHFTLEQSDASAVREPTGSATRPNPRLGKKLAARSVEKQHAVVPEGAQKIIIRPKEGINRILEEVGRLRVHVYLAQAARVDPEAADEDVASPNLTQQSIMIATLDAARATKYAAITALRIGPLIHAFGVEGVAFLSTPKADPTLPDIQFLFVTMNPTTPEAGYIASLIGISQIYESYYKLKQGQNVLMIVPVLLHPKSSGFIRLKSTDPEEYPIIDPQFLSNITDLDTLVAGAKIAVQTLKTQAMKNANVTIWDTALPACGSAGPLWSDSYLRCFVQHTSLSGWHPCCTAPMGTHPQAVLDARLRVLGGVKKLRVVDASSMPYIPAGNLNVPLMMMGHRAAAMIIEDNIVQD